MIVFFAGCELTGRERDRASRLRASFDFRARSRRRLLAAVAPGAARPRCAAATRQPRSRACLARAGGNRDHRPEHEVRQLVAERQHGGAGGERRRRNERGGDSRREDDSVVPELDASRQCWGDSRGDLYNELVNAKAVSHEVLDTCDDVHPVQSEVLQHAIVSRAATSDRALSAPIPV